ncbi:MAG: ATPase [Bacteroidetes bacterium RIFOXYA12_FULL_35_11]|nr:MAG: ATPase [Bacteroidetes bacterium GWF2_35_48]OFY79413.1 MAG: ATPase [Bacteroidetes bacterium RIFOXYA12_FULL_35_11]OFY99104.1 MAG: ATPase [Bacteroidetes bacterium RIFOXYC12_FULL_35_7]HBX53743.1 ATPase [Bacteroidales bacterium]
MKDTVFKTKLIIREAYFKKVLPFIGKSLIKVFTGQRRVGKSYLMFQVMEHIQKIDKKANIIYINKEDFSYDSIKNAADLNSYILIRSDKKKKNYIFIDEIQEIADFEKALRSLVLKDIYDVYCTGSNAMLLSGELSSLLSGRFVEIKVYSLSYPEFLMFHKLKDSDAALDKYFRFGGFPYLIHLEQTDEVVAEYLKNILNTIVYRDIVARYNVRNTHLLEQLIKFLADNTGSLFSSNSISEFLKSQNIKISPNQIQTYTGYLTNSYLMHKVERYDVVGKRIFETGEKYYFDNLGLRNSIWGYRQTDMGKILENAVFNHLQYKSYNIKTGIYQSNEIDFVCEKDNETIYIQVALSLNSEKTIVREFGNLLKINDNYPKIVVTRDSFSGNTYKGVRHVQIRKFLME